MIQRAIKNEPDEQKHGRGVSAALDMLDTFASVGVEFFDITHTNIDGEKRGFRRKRSLEETRRSMPFLVDAAAIRQNNVIVRPYRPPPVLLIQLDDLNAAAIERIRPAAFLILNTSPGNFQAWVAVENQNGTTDADFARRLRKGARADPTASGATRVAGTANFKRKYEPDFPVVAIAAAQSGKTDTRAALDAMGLLAPAEPVSWCRERKHAGQGSGPATAAVWTAHPSRTGRTSPTFRERILPGA